MTKTATLAKTLGLSTLVARLRAALARGPVPSWTEYLQETAGKA